MRRLLAVAALIALSCGGAATLPAPSPSPSRPALAAPSLATVTPIDVSGMMGAFPPSTFFVVRPGQVTAVALLNHATKYSIPTQGADVQVAVASGSQRLYVMDQTADGVRLRWFDTATGAPGATRTLANAALVRSTSAHGALAYDPSTSPAVFALVREGTLMGVEALDGDSLEPIKRVLGDLRCGDRLLAGGGRVVLACMNEGLVVVEGTRSFKLSTIPLVGLAILPDGTLMGGSSDGRLVRLAKDATQLEPVDTLRTRGVTLMADGIAAQGTCCFAVAGIGRVERVSVTILAGSLTLLSFPPSEAPSAGILVQPPFAYYTTGRIARHIDIEQGFGEVMATFDEEIRTGAVADR